MSGRLDVHFRVLPTTQRLTVTYPSGGAATAVDLPAGTTYTTATDLAAALHTLINAVSAHLSVTEASGVITITSDASNFDLATTHPSLGAWLGLSGTYTARASISGTCIGTWCPSLSQDMRAVARVVHTRRQERGRGSGRSVALCLARDFTAALSVATSEETRARSVMSLLMQGHPARWQRSSSTAAWSWAEPFGVTAAVALAPDMQATADEWVTQGGRQTWRILRVRFREVTA